MADLLTPLLALQPVAYVGEDCLVLTRGEHAVGSLVMASGAEHPLRCLCTQRTIFEHHAAISRAMLANELRAELDRRRSADTSDPLVYAVHHLAPALASSFFQVDEGGPPELPSGSSLIAFDEILDEAPMPSWVAPSLSLCGRRWMMKRSSPQRGVLTVRHDSESLVCTGEFVLDRSLNEGWRRDVAVFFEKRLRASRVAEATSNDQALAEAREAFARTGYWQAGDLLVVGGRPAFLGVVIPTHSSRTLRRHVRRDVALAVPWSQPPRVHQLQALQFEQGRGWCPLTLPNGICLGSAPRASADGLDSDPGLNVVNHLRWAAVRVAQNRRFHEHDP